MPPILAPSIQIADEGTVSIQAAITKQTIQIRDENGSILMVFDPDKGRVTLRRGLKATDAARRTVEAMGPLIREVCR